MNLNQNGQWFLAYFFTTYLPIYLYLLTYFSTYLYFFTFAQPTLLTYQPTYILPIDPSTYLL